MYTQASNRKGQRMLISCSELRRVWGVNPSGILHVGAHEAEELKDYQKQGWSKSHIIWVEAQPDLVQKLEDRLDPRTNTVIQAAVWNIDGKDLILNVASNSQSTSLLDLGTHSATYPDIKYVSKLKVKTSTLSNLLEGKPSFDFINLDIQGVELQALEGLGERLSKVKWIYTEVNSREVYKGCTLVTELDYFLKRNNFQRAWGERRGDLSTKARRAVVPTATLGL